MRMRHWEVLSAAANFSINPATEGVNLAYLLKHDLKDLESQLQVRIPITSQHVALQPVVAVSGVQMHNPTMTKQPRPRFKPLYEATGVPARA
jgi:hypothetical protein